MSIEKDLTRIADALEALVGKLDHIGQATASASVPEAPKQPVTPPPPEVVAGGASTPVTTAPIAAVPPAPPAAPATPAPTTASPPPTPAVPAQVTPPPVATMTPEDLNKALVAEFQRLGSREPIDTVMRAAPFNAQSITDLTPEQYAPLIAAVQAVKAG